VVAEPQAAKGNQAVKRKPTAADLLLPQHLKELEVFVVKEVFVCPWRKWRFDFAERIIPKKRPRLAFEIEGGIWIYGGHNRGKIYQENLDKYNTATQLGWTLFRFSSQDVLSGKAKEFVREWLDRQKA
jgi:hypothetical protein